MRRRTGLVVVLGIVAALAIELALAEVSAPRGGAPGRRPSAPGVALAAGTLVDKQLGRLPLMDEHGRRTSLAAFRGRYLLLAPSLALCHEVCPLTTGALMRLRRRLRATGLAGRVVVAEATVDPWRDSPARVRAFKRRTGSDIRFLTGTRPEIRHLWRTLGVEYHRVPQDTPPDRDWWTHRPETFDVTHTDGLFVIDPRGHWRVFVPGMPITPGRLAPRLSSLLNDQGRKNLAQPDMPWTVPAVLEDLRRLTGRPGPAPVRASQTPTRAPSRGRLLPGGPAAVRARLSALRGRPVVVNEWASWCPPCQRELPLLTAAATRYRGRVALLGLDVNDSGDAARRFLAQHPVGYSSYADPDAGEARALANFAGLPTTVFLGAGGKVVSVHIGQYTDGAQLRGDITRAFHLAG